MSQIKFQRFWQCCLIILLSNLAFGQQYNFKNYSLAEGLPQSQIYALCQDRNNYLWMGTRGGGLCRFDGFDFVKFSESDGLINNFVRTIAADSSGNLWIGTDQGLSKYDGKAFTSIGEKDGLKKLAINDLAINAHHQLWVASDSGVYFYEDGSFKDLSKQFKVLHQRITCLYHHVDGTTWLGSHNGIYMVHQQSGKYEVKYLNTSRGFNLKDITAIEGDEKGNVWIASYGKGVAFCDGEVFTNLTMTEGLPRNSIYCLKYAGKQKLWMGCSEGIALLNYSEGITSIKYTYYKEDNGLCNNVVRCLLMDSFANMWVGSSGGGVSRLDSERFIHFSEERGVLGDLIFSIAEDVKGQIWLASSEGGVTVFDGRKLKRISDKEGFTSGKVKCIYTQKNGKMWFGTTGGGVYVYDGHRFKLFSKKDGLSSKFINAIMEDAKGRVWLATTNGLCYFDPNLQKIKCIKNKELTKSRINTVFVDHADHIWLGLESSPVMMIKAHELNEEPEIVYFPKGPSKIRCITEDQEERILMGSAGKGLYLFDKNQMVPIDLKETEISGNVYSIFCDSNDRVWVGSDKGLHRFQINQSFAVKNLRTFTRASGYLGIEATHNSVYQDRKGCIWFGTIAGVFKYDPKEDYINDKEPTLMMKGINLFFTPLQNTPYYKDKSLNFRLPTSLSLPYDQNSLSFQFVGISLKEPESTIYRWKLEGFDADWSPMTERNEAVYANLQPGNYTFLVKAKNEDGFWSKSALSFSFTIEAPFWQTVWFRALMIVCIALGLLMIYWLRIKRLKRKNAQEREILETEKKLLELEQKALHLQMNPHFLFNCLNSIKGLVAENKIDESKSYINKFAKLMRSILDSSRESFVTLDKEIELIKNYVYLENLSRDAPIELEVILGNVVDPSTLKIPSMLIQPFVENAVLHGLAQKKDKALIRLSFNRTESFMYCTVEDNGIGRKATIPHREQLHTSAATQVIKERLKILTQRTDAVQLIDLVDGQGQATGTKVILIMNCIPY